MASGLAYVLKC